MGYLAHRERRVQESPRVERERTEAWTFAMAGMIAVFVGPFLAEIAGAHELIFLALGFGGAIGVLDTIGVEDTAEVATRTMAGLALGAFLAIGLFFYESILLGGLILGLGVVMSRWIWLAERDKNILSAAAAVGLGGAGVWAMALMVEPMSGWAGLTSWHPMIWGLGAGMAALAMELPGHLSRPRWAKKMLKTSGSEHKQGGGPFWRADQGEESIEEQRLQITEIYNDVVGALGSSAEDDKIRVSADAAVEAWQEVVSQREVISRFNPTGQRSRVHRRYEQLEGRAKAENFDGGEVEQALRELEEEMAQCEKLVGHAVALGARQERLRSALERLRLDAIHRRCNGLHESQVSTSLRVLNELVESSVTEREIFLGLSDDGDLDEEY